MIALYPIDNASAWILRSTWFFVGIVSPYRTRDEQRTIRPLVPQQSDPMLETANTRTVNPSSLDPVHHPRPGRRHAAPLDLMSELAQCVADVRGKILAQVRCRA